MFLTETRFRIIGNGVDIFTGWRSIDHRGDHIIIIEPLQVRNSVHRFLRTYAKAVKFTTESLQGSKQEEELQVRWRLKEAAEDADNVFVPIFIDEGFVQGHYCGSYP